MEKEERTLLSITTHEGFIETRLDSGSRESVNYVIIALVTILMENKVLFRHFLKVLTAALDDPEEFKKIYSSISSPPLDGLAALGSP